MQEVNFKLNVEAEKANKSVKELDDRFENLQEKANKLEEELANATDPDKIKFLKKELGEVNKELGKSTEESKKLGKAQKSSAKSTRFLGKGFRVLGGAMKAAGIGLIVAVVAKLTQAFSQNQAVMDGVNKVFSTINIVFQEVTTAITNAFKSTSKANGGFASTIAVIKNLMTLALTPLKLSFDAIKLVVQEAMLAWEKSMFGDGDPETIKELNKGIEETKQSIKETGEEAYEAGKGVAENFGGMVDEVSGFVEKAAEEVKKVNVDAASETADALVEMRKQVKLGEASLAGLTLQFQKQAEELRQERDDIRLSIEDRIKANEELGKVLIQQSQEELKIANQKLALAQKELALNPQNIDAQIAVKEARNGVLEIEERITGQKSEQRVNEAALLDEQKANLAELEKIGLKEVELAKQEANQKFQETKQLIERTVQEDKKKKELLKAAQQQFDLEMGEIEKEENLRKVERQKELEALLNEGKEYPDTIEGQKQKALAELDIEREKELQKAKDLEASETQLQAIKEKFITKEQAIKDKAAEQEKAREKAVSNAKAGLAMDGLKLIAEIAGKGSKIGKAVGIAQTTLSTIEGVQNAFTTASKSPITTLFPAYPYVQAGLAGAFGVAQIAKIKSTQMPNVTASGGATGGGGSAGGASVSRAQAQQAQAPGFNIVGDAGTNQIAETLGRNNNEPMKAYVVSKDVTNQQELDRNIEEGASLG